MLLSEKVQAIEDVFAILSQETLKFQGWSGITCKSGCSKCCTKPDIEATVLEFLPFAYYLYHQNQCLEWLKRIEEAPDNVCVVLDTNSGVGGCSEYIHRGLICRLFGFTARTNKYARKEFVTCNIIKTEQPAAYLRAQEGITQNEPVSVMNHYYMRMLHIDSDLARNFYPINEAIKRAIEIVLHYFAYTDRGRAA